MLCEVTGNVSMALQTSGPPGTKGIAWPFSVIILAHFLIAAAAFEQSQATSGQARTSRSKSAVSVLPYVSVLLGLAILVDTTVRRGDLYDQLGVVLGSVALTVLVVLRQIVVLHENREMAVTDALTGLANRAHLHETLSRALARSARNGKSVAVLLADLNGFKQINDTMGHAAGDTMLVEFSRMLRRSVLGSDLVARLGGDEFVVVLHDIAAREDAETVIRRIHGEMQMPVLIGDAPVQLRSAIGLALAEPGETDVDAVLRRADEGMYENKQFLKAAVTMPA
jgi:diguanylate cyclase (GGDEF)-like protein